MENGEPLLSPMIGVFRRRGKRGIHRGHFVKTQTLKEKTAT